MEPSQKARFLCGLRLDDEAVRVAVGMRLGLSLCVPHSCPCGEHVDAQGLHATVCKKAPGRIARHQVLNGATENAGVENAGLENAAPDCRGGKRGSSTVWKAEVSVI